MTYELDTTGAVALTRSYPPARTLIEHQWSDLSPFTQGYVEAIFADGVDEVQAGRHLSIGRPIAFRDLAPETLARITSDCEGLVRLFPGDTARNGAAIWTQRKERRWTDFPPLTAHLGDDGKVYFAA